MTQDVLDDQQQAEPTLDETLDSAFDAIESAEQGAPAEDAAPVAEKGPVRDEAGRFAPKAADESKPAAEPVAAPAAEAPAPVDAAPTDAPKVPGSWTPAAKAQWAALPPAVQAEVHKREADFQRGLQQYATKARDYDAIHAEIAPYEAMIRSENGTPATAIRSLLNTAYLLRTASAPQKQQLFAQMAQQFGVDLGALTQQAPYVDPALAPVMPVIDQMQQRMQMLEQQRQQELQQRQQIEAQQHQAEVQAFAADPANIYLPNVGNAMAALLQSGQATDLKDAYDKACWANPEVRSALLAQQASEAENRRRQEAQARAAQARRVQGTNVRSSPAAPPRAVSASLDDTLNDAYERLTSAAA